MRNFIVTIENKKYEVTVEEVQSFNSPQYTQPQQVVAAPAPQYTQPQQVAAAPAPQAAPALQAAPAPQATSQSGSFVESPMPGLILNLKVQEGASVKAGEVVIVLEAMKMENDIAAPVDGVISYKVAKGANVDSGTLLAVIS